MWVFKLGRRRLLLNRFIQIFFSFNGRLSTESAEIQPKVPGIRGCCFLMYVALQKSLSLYGASFFFFFLLFSINMLCSKLTSAGITELHPCAVIPVMGIKLKLNRACLISGLWLPQRLFGQAVCMCRCFWWGTGGCWVCVQPLSCPPASGIGYPRSWMGLCTQAVLMVRASRSDGASFSSV